VEPATSDVSGEHSAPAGNLCGSLDGLPLMLSVSEAAAVLRISRTSAYRLIQEHRATKGLTGLPHVRLGSRVLVRRSDLAHIVGVEVRG
jgi:excisionase family DNA binding protein